MSHWIKEALLLLIVLVRSDRICDSLYQQILLQVSLVTSQVWDVDRLIRARNPGAVFTTTERVDVTWQTLRSITYSPTLQQGAVGSASVQEASLVRRSVQFPVFISFSSCQN